MLLSKSGPTDICPLRLPAVRLHHRTPIPARRGAVRSGTPTGAACEMLRQISAGVKLMTAEITARFPSLPGLAILAEVGIVGHFPVIHEPPRHCREHASAAVAVVGG